MNYRNIIIFSIKENRTKYLESLKVGIIAYIVTSTVKYD